MTLIQNGSYFWLKMNYHMYLSFLELLSEINYPSLFWGVSASEESIKVTEIACSTSQNRNFSHLGIIRRIF